MLRQAYKISSLDFWVAGDSSDMRRGKAHQLHNMFDAVFSATFAAGATRVNSINAMAQVLIDGDSTIQVLAETADEKYDFSDGSL